VRHEPGFAAVPKPAKSSYKAQAPKAGLTVPNGTKVTVTTSNATLTTIATISVPTNLELFQVFYLTFGNRTDVDGDSVTYKRRISVKRNGAALTSVLADGDVDLPGLTGVSTTWVVQATASGTNILLQVQGAVGKTISWTTYYSTGEGL
jgi:hypothetical protein